MSDAELIDHLFHLLSEFLSTEWTGKRQPYSFLQHFRTASSSHSDNTSRIFLDSGFKAWVAYHVFKPITANAYGQAYRRRQFGALDCLPVGEKKRLAVKVNEVPPHLTVASLVLSMEQEARLTLVPSKRPHIEREDFVLSSSPAYPAPSYPQLFKDGSGTSTDLARLADSTVSSLAPVWTPRQQAFMPIYSSTDPSPRSLQVFTDLSRGATNSSISPKPEILVGADIAELDLFPEFLAGVIKRNDISPKTAAVTFEFPRDSIADINCAMSIVVFPNKVERLALLLFNAYLETNGTVRELILPGGLCVIPKQLQGSPLEAVTNVFGPTVAAALESALYRKIELSEAALGVGTCCVTMSECSDVYDGAVITVVLGRREASKMYEKLFKSCK
ncbi:hypothetical protein F5883DRAFT_660200 [Diaporthe sp. PMI_573]|nr:hypothetical protein F5883DRAFT_660200 [Diaporthaceae sp. PMI_573]